MMYIFFPRARRCVLFVIAILAVFHLSVGCAHRYSVLERQQALLERARFSASVVAAGEYEKLLEVTLPSERACFPEKLKRMREFPAKKITIQVILVRVCPCGKYGEEISLRDIESKAGEIIDHLVITRWRYEDSQWFITDDLEYIPYREDEQRQQTGTFGCIPGTPVTATCQYKQFGGQSSSGDRMRDY